MGRVFSLRNADILRLAVCKVGANRQRIFLLKSGGDETPTELLAPLVKEAGSDWQTAYVPVAVPGEREDPGLGGGAGDEDEWEPAEIVKAAHSFIANGGEVSTQHFQGADGRVKLVESAVALADFEVGDPPRLIKEGTWYVGLGFDPELRKLVDAGEIDAVSVEGFADRIAKVSLARSPKQNWIERLPKPMQTAFEHSIIHRAAEHMVFERGMSVGHAIASAINWSKHICATGDVKQWRGPQTVNPKSVAECCAAVALWNTMKATASAQGVAKEYEAIEEIRDTLESVEPSERTLLQKIGRALGITDDDEECAGCGDFDGEHEYEPDYIAKKQFTAARREQMAARGAAMSHGGFPIEDCGDVRNAVRALGRAKNPQAAKAHIIRRARSLGCVSDLPDTWKTAKEDGSLETETGTLGSMDEGAVNERFEKIEGRLDALDGEEGRLAKMQGTLEGIAKRLPEPEPEAPKPGELSEKLEEVAAQQATINETLTGLAKSVEQLEEGDSSQPDPERERVAKANGEGDSAFAGIIFPEE